ncbi:MAG: TatD family hydrolase [Rikenellaceae bacterium]|nr:TatD family hydrolase [Rikenellaceae bacterium]
MYFIDTHTHLFDERFDDDRADVIFRAVDNGVKNFILPATDTDTHEKVICVVREFPGICYAMMGLHPTSVNDNSRYRSDLQIVEKYLDDKPIDFIAVGEIGLDLYWSKDYLAQQEEALRFQLDLALKHALPVSLHVREAFAEIFRVLDDYAGKKLKGVFHSFSGTIDDYRRIKSLGDFKVGISGPVTYKKSPLPEVLEYIPLEDIILETDAPYLPPVPYRGKRNESAYLPLIARKIAEIKEVTVDIVAEATTANAKKLFSTISE